MKRTLLAIALICLLSSRALANDIVDVAKTHIGKGETISDNHGPAVREYLNGQEGLP